MAKRQSTSSVLEVLESRTLFAISLSFPVEGQSAFSAPIVSVFDHSMNGQRYRPDGQVVTFAGEVGYTPNPNEPAVTFNGYQLRSFYKAGGGNFTLDGANYVGTQKTGPGTINYDGHPGYDYSEAIGTKVDAAAEGDVLTVSSDSASGNYIIIQHPGGYQTTYLHLSKVLVAQGQHVFSGTRIAESGDTGAAAGHPHLHFEVKHLVNGTFYSVDPYGWQGSGTDPYTAMTPDHVVNEKLWGSTPVQAGPPSAVNNFTWSRVYVAPRAIYMSWSDSSNETSYNLQFWNGYGWQNYASLAANSTGSYTFFSQSGTYYLRVVAVNSYGSTASNWITVTV